MGSRETGGDEVTAEVFQMLIRCGHVIELVDDELVAARKKFPSFGSDHEGYAVILEELDELWDAVKANDPEHARRRSGSFSTGRRAVDSYAEFLAAKDKRVEDVGFAAVSELPAGLFDWQVEIVRWALRRGRAAIFAECGLGKTLMQLAWADQVRRKTGRPVLILAPVAVSIQTVHEAAKFGINANVCAHQSDVNGSIAVTNYEKLDHFDPAEFAGVVLDESSILKAQDGKRRTQIIESFEGTPYRLACTATPAPNDHTELGNHGQFLGVMAHHEMLSMFFVHDGGSTQSWRLKGHAKDAFWRWVCSWACVVTHPSDLGYDDDRFTLPPIRYEKHIIPVEAQCAGLLFHTGENFGITERRRARRNSMAQRVECVAEMVNASTEPWVVWCDLNAEGDALEKAIHDAVQIAGRHPIEEKERMLVDFIEGRARVLVTKSKIAGFGMNMQHCAKVAFCGLSDSYESFYQTVRRCWRFGQTRDVEVHIAISDVEEPVARNIERKEADASELMSEVARRTRAIMRDEIKGANMTKDEYATLTVGDDNGDWTMRLGDCVEALSEMGENNTVDYSVFSPPFDSLYTYSASVRDMGNCDGGEDFARHFGYLIEQLHRVIRPGRLVSFHCMNLPTLKARDGFIGIRDFRGELIRAFTDVGFIFHSEVVIWKDPVTSMQRTKALGLLHKQLKKDSCMSRQGIPDYVVTMRKPGVNGDPVTNTNETFPVAEWQEYASPVWMDINPSETLQGSSAREHEDERHISPLQLEVIRRCLRLWSKPGDLVLSPFAGIGSEGFEAVKAGRRFLGIELKRSYFEQACRNLERAVVESKSRLLFSETK